MTLQKFSNTTEKSYINKTLILYLFVHLQKAPLKCQCNNIANYMYDHCTNIFLIQHQNLFNNAHNCSSSELTWSSEIYLYSCLEVSAISRRVSHTLELAAAILAMDSFFLDPFFPFFLKKQVLKKNHFCLRFFCIIHIWLFIIPQKIGLILVYILAL